MKYIAHDGITMDPVKNCIIIKSEIGFNNADANVQSVLRCIKQERFMSWSQLAGFLGIGKSSSLFKAYISKKKATDTVNAIAKQLFITADRREMHLYRIGYAPADGTYPAYTPVSITCNEPKDMVVYTKIPSRVLTRTSISDPLDRCLSVTLSPTNGYILDDTAGKLATDGAVYAISGRAGAVTRMMKNLHFVGLREGDASIVVASNDNTGSSESEVATTISFKVEQSEIISVPTVETKDAVGFIDELTVITDVITVDDKDNKIMGLRATPFDCEISGFINDPSVFRRGEVFSVTGIPSYLNSVVKNITVKPLLETAYIGVEVISIDPAGTASPIRIQKYVTITSEPKELPEEPSPEVEQPVPTPVFPEADDSEDTSTIDDTMLVSDISDIPSSDNGMIIPEDEAMQDAPVQSQEQQDPAPIQEPTLEEWKAEGSTISNVAPVSVAGDFTTAAITNNVAKFTATNILGDSLPQVASITLGDSAEVTNLSVSPFGNTSNTITAWELVSVDADGVETKLGEDTKLTSNYGLQLNVPLKSTVLLFRIMSVKTPTAKIPGITVTLTNDNKHDAYYPSK